METQEYNPSSAVPAKRKYKPRKIVKGITFPKIIEPNTGIHTTQLSTGPRYRVWYKVDGKRKYVSLPAGATITLARSRRDALYVGLAERYGAKERTPKPASPNLKPRKPLPLAERKLIIHIPEKFVIRYEGKYIGEGRTREIAEKKLAAWFAANVDVPASAGEKTPTKKENV